jgi:choline-sulfatase
MQITKIDQPEPSPRRMLNRTRPLWLGLFVVAGLAACSPAPPPPDLILISLDTVRADTFAEVAASSGTFRRLRDGGVVFSHARTPTPITLPAHTTLLSGREPDQHGVRNNGQRVPAALALLPERLRAAGYATAAVVSAFPLDRRFGLERGFDVYDQPPEPAPGARSAFATLERPAQASVARALELLDAVDRPQFLWLHLFDAHAPYVAPDSDPAASRADRYAAEVRHLDAQLQPLLARLEQRARPFVLVLVADHGEGLGDHGELDHGLLLYESTLHVPMLWYAPDRFAPRAVDAAPRLSDVAPTLLALAGAEPFETSDGIDLAPALRGEALTIPPAYAETHYPRYAYARLPLHAWTDGAWKFIDAEDAARSELYDLTDDPSEASNQRAAHEDTAQRMTVALDRRKLEAEPLPSSLDTADAEVQRRLQSLGYLGSGAADVEAAGDARDMIEAHRRLVLAQEALSDGHVEQAQAQARALLELDPRNGFAAFVLGSIHLDRGAFADAALAFEQTLESQPENTEAHFRLGETRMRQGRWADALRVWQVLEVLEPERVAVWTNEAAALANLGLWDEAAVAIGQALRLAPDDAAALDNGIAIAQRRGQWRDVASLMQRQRDMPPGHGERVALAWLRAGDWQEAERALATEPEGREDRPALTLARILIALERGDQASATTLARELSVAQPAFWQAARRQFTRLDAALPPG